MLVFLPPLVQALVGAGLLAAAVAVHNVILGALGCLGLVVAGARWLRRRGGAGGNRGGFGGGFGDGR
jgi:hypothetical protein